MGGILQVDTIQNNNTSNLITQTNVTTITIGVSGQTITIPSGATLNTTTIVLAAGAVGTPSLTTSGDTNTGIFFPTADTIAFTEGGSEAMRINSSGNVGIGTTNPTNKLHLSSTLATGGILNEDNNDSSASPPIICIGKRADNNGSQVFSGRIALAKNRTDAAMGGDNLMGTVYFGGNHTNGTLANIAYAASISGFSQGTFNSASDMPTGLIFLTGSTGIDLATVAQAGTERMRIDSSGSLILVGSTAQKATGTTWSNPSDTRLKDNKQNYTKGLTELLQINVKTWEWNGKAGTTEGTTGIGVIADEIENILPNTVDTYKAKLNIDDTEETDVKRFDATEITWLLLNSVKEQQAIIEELKARLIALENN